LYVLYTLTTKKSCGGAVSGISNGLPEEVPLLSIYFYTFMENQRKRSQDTELRPRFMHTTGQKLANR
jgi:hypothetical protein